MISENIMHDCIVKLLRSGPKSEGVQNEDSLECLCQLLTTIGKDLDHEKAKVSMINPRRLWFPKSLLFDFLS